MNGRIVIDLEDNGIRCEGKLSLGSKVERYAIVKAVTDCLDITTPDEWAELVMLCLMTSEEKGKMERYEMRIPKNGKDI